MNKHIGKITVLFLFIGVHTFGQIGFLNKKNTLSVNGLVNTPMFSGNFKESIYKKKGDELASGREFVNYGYSLEYSRQLTRAFSLGLETVVKETKLISPSYFLTSNIVPDNSSKFDSSYLKMEQIEAFTTSFMLRMEFSNRLGISPGGIIHSISIGFSKSQLRNKDYAYSLNSFEPASNHEDKWTEVDNYYLTSDIPKFTSTTFSYALTYRHPFTKQLMGNVGVRYLFNYALKPSDTVFNEHNPHPFDHQTLFFDLQRENIMTISLQLGLSFVF